VWTGQVRKLRKKKREVLDLEPLKEEEGDRGTREDRAMSTPNPTPYT
jgi:hypothetical protein